MLLNLRHQRFGIETSMFSAKSVLVFATLALSVEDFSFN